MQSQKSRVVPKPNPIILIPAFNEEHWIWSTVMSIRKTGFNGTILVVDDGSKDGTIEVAKRHGCEVLELRQNVGKANAFFAGIKHALHLEATSVTLLDADLTRIPKDSLDSLIEAAEKASRKGIERMFIAPSKEGNKEGISFFIDFSGQRSFSRIALQRLRASRVKRFAKGYSLELFLNTFFRGKTRGTTGLFYARPGMVKDIQAFTQVQEIEKFSKKEKQLEKRLKRRRPIK